MKTSRKRGRPRSDEITDVQRKTLAAIRDFQARRTFPPTMSELGALLEVTPASAHQLVKQLERKGYIKRTARTARGLTIIRDPSLERGSHSEFPSLTPLPLVGLTKGGPAMLAEENRLGEVLVESHIAGRGQCFALAVSGDSMKGAGIHDGDVVIVRRQPVAENSDIVVALIGDEATVKRLWIQGDRIELRPENRRYKPISISGETEFRILGKVLAIRRSATR
jgi:repressor LexA